MKKSFLFSAIDFNETNAVTHAKRLTPHSTFSQLLASRPVYFKQLRGVNTSP